MPPNPDLLAAGQERVERYLRALKSGDYALPRADIARKCSASRNTVRDLLHLADEAQLFRPGKFNVKVRTDEPWPALPLANTREFYGGENALYLCTSLGKSGVHQAYYSDERAAREWADKAARYGRAARVERAFLDGPIHECYRPRKRPKG